MLRDFKDDDRLVMSNIIRSNADLYDDLVPGAFDKYAEKLLSKDFKFEYKVEIISNLNRDVGFIGYDEDSNKIFLVALYLDCSVQGMGLGRKVLELLKQNSQEQGKREIALLAHKDAKWAIGFYEKLGFNIMAVNEEDIVKYNMSIISKYYLPNTILMSLKL